MSVVAVFGRSVVLARIESVGAPQGSLWFEQIPQKVVAGGFGIADLRGQRVPHVGMTFGGELDLPQEEEPVTPVTDALARKPSNPFALPVGLVQVGSQLMLAGAKGEPSTLEIGC